MIICIYLFVDSERSSDNLTKDLHGSACNLNTYLYIMVNFILIIKWLLIKYVYVIYFLHHGGEYWSDCLILPMERSQARVTQKHNVNILSIFQN